MLQIITLGSNYNNHLNESILTQKGDTFTAYDLLRLHCYQKDLEWQIPSGYLNILFVC